MLSNHQRCHSLWPEREVSTSLEELHAAALNTTKTKAQGIASHLVASNTSGPAPAVRVTGPVPSSAGHSDPIPATASDVL
jgi:hypothetical protein